MNKKQFFKEGVQAGIPIALGYFAVSFTFGMMSVANGLNASEAALISLTNLTSAGQFAGLDIIRDCIAFPKNNKGRDVMLDAPAALDQKQLDELSLVVDIKE